jgi:hypothetical protein
MSGQGIWDKLQNVDRRVFYWILFIGLTVPFLTPLGLPITVTPSSQAYFDGLSSIQKGEVVVLSINSGVSAWGDCLPAMTASVHKVYDQGGKLIVWSIGYNDVDITWAKIKEKLPMVFEGSNKWVEGQDYAYFGYCPGQETNVALLRDNIRGVYTQDVRGVKTDDIPMMKDINGANKIKFVLSSDTGDAQMYYIRQWKNGQVNYEMTGKPPTIAEMGIAMNKSGDMVYYLSGDEFGLVAGSRGAAEIEALTGYKGDATTTMDSISVSHVLLILAIILANVGMLATRGKKK